MEQEAVRWNIRVSKKTDVSVRTFLGAKGAHKGALARFIEESVRWRIFDGKIQDIKQRNAASDPEEVQHAIDEAVREVRAERRAKKPRKF